jgi:hypothetical protein
MKLPMSALQAGAFSFFFGVSAPCAGEPLAVFPVALAHDPLDGTSHVRSDAPVLEREDNEGAVAEEDSYQLVRKRRSHGRREAVPFRYAFCDGRSHEDSPKAHRGQKATSDGASRRSRALDIRTANPDSRREMASLDVQLSCGRSRLPSTRGFLEL